LWAVNTQVRVVIPAEGIDAVFLIAERSLSLDSEGGSITRLQVMHRNAFIGEAVKPIKKVKPTKKVAPIKKAQK
jgi:prophage tail gpP-like protein